MHRDLVIFDTLAAILKARMRRFLLIPALAAIIWGCGDGGSNGTGGNGAIGGSGTGGSGGVGGAGTTEFSASVIGTGGPLPARPVMYATSDGVHLVTLITDDDGRVTFTDLPTGGFITAPVVENATMVRLQTVAGIGYGDTIELRASGADEATVGGFSISVSNLSAGTSSYNVFVPTDQFSNPSGSNDLFEGLLNAATIAPGGLFNAIGIANVEGRQEIGFAADVPIEGAPPTQSAAAAITSWGFPTGFINARITNVSGGLLSVLIRTAAYRDARPYQARNFTNEVSEEFTARLPQSSDFNDRAVATFELGDSVDTVLLRAQNVVAADVGPEDTNLETSSAEFLPQPINATRNIDALTSSYGWSPPPDCDGAALDASLLSFTGVLDQRSYAWTMLAPYSDVVTMPALDPELTNDLFPEGIVEEAWTLEARAYVSAEYEAVRRTAPAFLTPEQWLGRQQGEGKICVAAASLGLP